MDCEELTVDVIINTGTLSSIISERDTRKVHLLAQQSKLKEKPPPESQGMVAAGHFETTTSTVELQIKMNDLTFKKPLVVRTSRKKLSYASSMEQKITDIPKGLLHFPFVSIKLKNVGHTYSKVSEPLLNPYEIVVQQSTKIILWSCSEVLTTIMK